MDMARAAAVREIVVTANEEALNTAITENQIQPEKIISVVFEPRRHLAIGDHEAKYRVLYRL
jgi:chorismate mutase